jgi:Dolichyl-phosphate-mannose-protein mannosyltransferase
MNRIPVLPRSSSARPYWGVWLIALSTAALHLATAGGYDAFRNELYFIVCGRHPAFGYADQPSLVPLLAAATQAFGDNVWLLRLPAALAAVALVPLCAAFARLLGGNVTASVIAALAAAIAPALAGMTTTLTTSTFEPLAWTACAYCIARAIVCEQRRALIAAGLIAGISMQAKYGIAIWLIGLGAGVLLTDARRVLRWPEFWIGAALAAAIAAPSFIWQMLNDWPFFEVRHNHRATEIPFAGNPLQFEITQILALNPLLAPLWLAGVVAPWSHAQLYKMRSLSIAFVVATLLMILLHGKDYYLFPAYASMFALGAVVCGNLARPLLAGWLVVAVAISAMSAPLVYPLLDPATLQAYMERTNLRIRPDESAAVGAPLTQLFSDELGWRRMAQQVADVYNSLSPDERARAAIMASNYGEAAAIDVYGPALGLPPAISGQNQYFLWGAHGADGSVIVHVNGDPQRWRRVCSSLDVAGSIGAPYVMPYENDRPIFICRGLNHNLAAIWNHFKRYD